MEKPVIFLLDEDPRALRAIRRELEQRYAADYQVICEGSRDQALARLDALQKAGAEVVVLLADCVMTGTTGVAFLAQAHKRFPQARRGLLMDWLQPTCSDRVIVEAMALNKIDAFTAKPPLEPSNRPSEEFHNFVSEFLAEWARENRPQFVAFRIVGNQWDPRSYELRDLLKRNHVSYDFADVRSAEGRALLAEAKAKESDLPVVLCYDGQVLTNPSNAALAENIGARTAYQPPEDGSPSDVVIVGAGPAGLSAAVNSASEGLRTVMIEREALGGQAGMSSRIRNYLGFATGISGEELAFRAYRQAQLFGMQTIFTQEVTGLRVEGDRRVMTLSDGTEIPARAVILAMGVVYRRLAVPALETLVGSGVFYGAVGTEAMALRGKDVYIVGGANSAGQAAVHLSRYARRVTMVVRAGSLAASMSEYLINEIKGRDNIEMRFHTQVTGGGGEYRLEWLLLQDNDTGQTETRQADALFSMIGATPRTGWLPPDIRRDPIGFILTGEHLLKDGAPPAGWPLKRLPMTLETSQPGVFAAGDVRHRSVKRVASAVGEGAMCVQYVHQYFGEADRG
jgi:thioredoxin reductase (NADPH)